MGIKINRVHCFFEQSGTFKNEFVKIGIPAEDYDIQNNFGQTDNVIDLFGEIEKAFDNRPSLFDGIRGGQDGDLIMVRVRTAPELAQLLKEANDEVMKGMRKELPRYKYDCHVITSIFVGKLSRLGIDFAVPVEESIRINGLDEQKKFGVGIYGSGYLVSDTIAAAEAAAAVKEWQLSEREKKIVEELTKAGMEKD